MVRLALIFGYGPCLAARLSPRPRPVTRIVSHSRTAPAWGTSPFPSEDTATLVLRALLFTQKVPSARDGQDSTQALLSQVKGTFFMQMNGFR
jgi:hypothetical protein